MIRSVEIFPYSSIVLHVTIVQLVHSSYIPLKRSRSLQNTLSLKQTLESFHQAIDQTVIITLFQTLHGETNPTPL